MEIIAIPVMTLVVRYPDAGVLSVKFKPAGSTERRLEVGGVKDLADNWYHAAH